MSVATVEMTINKRKSHTDSPGILAVISRAMSEICSISDFTNLHSFVIRDELKVDEQAITWLLSARTTVDQAIAANAERLVAAGDHTWPLVRSMVDRAHDHAAAAVVCHFTGIWASMEVVVRATIESAVTVIFVTQAERKMRLGQYLADYFAHAKKDLNRCEMSKWAVQARNDLATREKIVRDVAVQLGIPFDAAGWPSKVIDRFKNAGLESDYRHIYCALSSQVHSDADTLIDWIIWRLAIEKSIEAEGMLKTEMLYWMRVYFYSGIRYYVIAAKCFSTAYALGEGIFRLELIEAEVTKHLELLNREFEAYRAGIAKSEVA